MVCPICGKEYGSRSKYCICCGVELVNEIIPIDNSCDNNKSIENETETVTDIICDNISLQSIHTEINEKENDNLPKSESESRKNIQRIKNSIIEDDYYNDCINNIGIIPEETLIQLKQNEIEFNDSLNISPDNPEDNLFDVTANFKKTKERFLSRLCKNTLSFITAVLMTIFVMLCFGSFVGRLITDNQSVADFVEHSDLLSIPANELKFIDIDDYDINPNATVLEAIYTMSAGSGVTKDNIRLVYESPSVKKFLSNNITRYTGFVRTGKVSPRITTDEIKEVFYNNLDLINSLIGTSLTENDIELALKEIDKTAPVLEKISTEQLDKNSFNNFTVPLRIYISMPVLIIEVFLALFMAVIIVIINKKISKALGWLSVSMILSGTGILVLTYLASMKIIFAGINSNAAKYILYSITDIISGKLYIIGAAIFLVGILFIAVSNTVKGKI